MQLDAHAETDGFTLGEPAQGTTGVSSSKRRNIATTKGQTWQT